MILYFTYFVLVFPFISMLSSIFQDLLPNVGKYRSCLYKQHFHKQHQGELAKTQAKAKLHPEAELLLFESY